MKNIKFLVVGILFGIIMVKSEAVSWFRIQEMFRFHSFHMYGIIGTAIITGIIAIQLIKYLKLKTINGEPIEFVPKDKLFGKYLGGGILFGLGWALTGACPGPQFVNLGYGYFSFIIIIISAVIGTFIFGLVKDKIPSIEKIKNVLLEVLNYF